MVIRTKKLLFITVVTGLLTGCSSGSNPFTSGNILSSGQNLTTSSVSTQSPMPATQMQMAAPRIDPNCVVLNSRIDQLRKEGFVENIEKISNGKTSNVTIKRDTLAKVTELQKANAEFQAKCSTLSTIAANTAGAQASKPVAVAGAPMPAPTAMPKP